MRVISGIRKGSKLFEFEGSDIRPTTDRVKESMFNLIQEYVPGGRVLDLFGGSGALSLEAVSRGAECAVCLDIDPRAIALISKNREKLRFDKEITVLKSSAEEFIASTRESFDIILMDPPYNRGFIRPIMEKIVQKGILSDGGIIALESDYGDEHGELDGLTVINQRRYGRTYVTVYQRGE